MFEIDYRFSMVTDSELRSLEDSLKKAHYSLLADAEARKVGIFDVVESDSSVAVGIADDLKRKGLSKLVLSGIGGSSLGAEALIQAVLGKDSDFLVFDNVDPYKVARLLSKIDFENSCVNVVSKSGSTAETIANFAVLYKYFTDKIGWEEFKERLVITTDPQKGPLRKFAELNGLYTLVVPENVSGRFSVLSDVGIFPSYFMGCDINKLKKGAREIIKKFRAENVFDNPAWLLCAVYYISYKKGKNIIVMMPYAERLSKFSEWFRQIWAESLGKNGYGQTPVKALGVVDQHSQIQLYNDGPRDKIITLIQIKDMGYDIKIPAIPLDDDRLNYLYNKNMQKLFKSEFYGTAAAFVKYNVPFIRLILDKIDEEVMGELFMVYEIATAIFGYIIGINPFDQPAVEEGKRFTYGLMGRKGFEEKLKEVKEIFGGEL